MTVAIVSPFYFCSDPARAEITRRVFKHYSLIDAVFIGVGSEGDLSREIFCRDHPESQYREFVQDFDIPGPAGSRELREKFNFAVRAAREYEPDRVFIVGSDDMIPPQFFRESDADLLGLSPGSGSGVYFWPYRSARAFWWEGYAPDSDVQCVGGVLGMSLRLLDELDWRPFQFKSDEIGLERYVRATSGSVELRSGMPSWHPKAHAVLNSFDLILRNRRLVNAAPDVLAEFLEYWECLA